MSRVPSKSWQEFVKEYRGNMRAASSAYRRNNSRRSPKVPRSLPNIYLTDRTQGDQPLAVHVNGKRVSAYCMPESARMKAHVGDRLVSKYTQLVFETKVEEVWVNADNNNNQSPSVLARLSGSKHVFFGPTILEFDTTSPVANFEHGGALPYAQCEEGETYVFDVFKNYIVRLSKPGPPMSDIEIQYSTMQDPDERYHSSDSLPGVFAVDQRGRRVDDSRGRANISSSPGSEYDKKMRAKLSVRRLVKPLSNLDNDSWMKSSVAVTRKEYVSLTQEHMLKNGISFVLKNMLWGGNAKK